MIVFALPVGGVHAANGQKREQLLDRTTNQTHEDIAHAGACHQSVMSTEATYNVTEASSTDMASRISRQLVTEVAYKEVTCKMTDVTYKVTEASVDNQIACTEYNETR